MELLKRDGEIMFLGDKKLPERIVEVGDEVTLKTQKYDFQVKVNKADGENFEGSVLRGGAYPDYQLNDTVHFKYDNIFGCNKADSR